MVCLIDLFPLDIKDMESFQKSISLPFGNQKRVANHPLHQNVEKFSETFSFEATFYYKNTFYLKPIELIAKQKKPVSLVFLNGEVYKVVVTNLEIVKSYFNKNRQAIKQDIKFTIEVFYE